VKVYWFDDGPSGGCRIPDAWEIEYLSGGTWRKVPSEAPLAVTRDAWNIAEIEPVKTTAIRINVKLNKDFSSGIHEVIIE
jgi:hypothetical protein